MSLNIAILASGRGSNAKAILEAICSGVLDATVVCVVANVESAPVLAMAETFGVPVHCVPHKGLTRTAHETQLLTVLRQYDIDVVALAGYMRLLTPQFLQAFAGYRIVNIHPSLLPAFPGVHGYRDAFEHGVKMSGVTVHFVTEGMDEGPIIAQRSFERLDTDTLAQFEERGLAVEHQLYPEALQLLAEGRVKVQSTAVSSRAYVEVLAHVPA